MTEGLEERLQRAADHRQVTPGSVAVAELGARADHFGQRLAELEQHLIRAAAAYDGELDGNPGFNALDYLLEKIGRVEQAAAALCHDLERVTGKPRPRPSTVSTSPPEALNAAAELLAQWCADRVPAQAQHQIRVEFKRRGRTLTIVERRPSWPAGEGEWASLNIAQFRYDAGEWSLWRAGRRNRWHEYVDVPSGGGFEILLREVDQDPTAAFWG